VSCIILTVNYELNYIFDIMGVYQPSDVNATSELKGTFKELVTKDSLCSASEKNDVYYPLWASVRVTAQVQILFGSSRPLP
jgi:hypothetical protein